MRTDFLRRGRRLAVVAVGLVVGLAAGCGDGAGSGLPEPSPTGAVVTASPTPAVDPEHEPVLAAFHAYVAASNEAANAADENHPALREHVTGAALTRLQLRIGGLAEDGLHYAGSRVVSAVRVTRFEPDVAFPEPAASVTACVDVGELALVSAGDQSPVAGELRGLDRFVSTVELVLLEDQWRVSESDEWWFSFEPPGQEQPC